MKKLITLIIIFLNITSTIFSQVSINTDGSFPDSSSMLDVKSVERGLLIPRMTSTQRMAIKSPVEGLMVYDTDLGSLCFYRSGEWNQALYNTSGWSLNGNAGTDHSTDFLGTTDNNALVFKFNNIKSGMIDTTSAFFGYTAGKETTGSFSTLIGSGAGWMATSGNSNTAIGYQVLYNNTTGSNNTVLGCQAGNAISTGSNNIVIGYMADVPFDTASHQMVIGSKDLFFGDLYHNRIGIGTTTPRQQLEITGNFVLPVTSNSSGIIYRDSLPWLHNFGAEGTEGLNTFLGTCSGNLTLTGSGSGDEGSYNTGIAHYSLTSLTTGMLNTAVGVFSLYSNTEGNYNTAIGEGALKFNTSGSCNTAVGLTALKANTTSSGLTAIGSQAMLSNTSGFQNTSIGSQSLMNNSSGYQNTAIGSGAMGANVDGYACVAIGVDALAFGTNCITNVAIGNSSLSKSQNACNVGVGGSTLMNLTSGLDNIAVGSGAQLNNISGSENIGIGVYSMNDKTSGDANTVIGQYAMWKNVSGYTNTTLGNRTGYWNNGSGNIFIGDSAAFYETGSDKLYIENSDADSSNALIFGNFATNKLMVNGQLMVEDSVSVANILASGNLTMPNATTTTGIIYRGASPWLHNLGINNVFLGKDAGNMTLSGGDNNTGIGDSTLSAMISGGFNVAVGFSALKTITTGSNNTALGYNAGCSASDLINTTAIGYLASADSSNQIRLGNSEITSLYCIGAYAGAAYGSEKVDLCADNTGKIGYSPSSARYKDDVFDMEEVDWLYELRPVNFTYKSDEVKKKQYGLIAEEVEKVNPLFVHYNSDGQVETVSYSQLIAPMIKAIQEQENTIAELKGNIDLMKSEREQLLRNQEMMMLRLEAMEKEQKTK